MCSVIADSLTRKLLPPEPDYNEENFTDCFDAASTQFGRLLVHGFIATCVANCLFVIVYPLSAILLNATRPFWRPRLTTRSGRTPPSGWPPPWL